MIQAFLDTVVLSRVRFLPTNRNHHLRPTTQRPSSVPRHFLNRLRMASQSPYDTHLADQKVKTLVNAQLKSILKKETLAVSGVKAAMQHRIISRKI